MLFNKSSCYFISVLIFFTSCISVTTSFRTFTNPYNKIPTANENLELMVIHDDERTSSLFYRFPSPLLTYKKSERDTFFRSSFRLVYRLREHPGNRKTGDSVSLLFKDAVRSISMHDVSGKVKLKVPQGKQFFLEVSVQDIHSGNRINEFLIINKMNRESAQNYRLLFDSVQSYSRYYVDKPTQLQLINEQNLNDSIIYAEFYIYKSEIAYVPFATPKTSNIKIKPDSVIYLSRSDNHYTYNLLHPGIYFFKTKKETQDGLSISLLPSSANEKASIRYITTRIEYDSLLNPNSNNKTIFDKWKFFGGDELKAIRLQNEWVKRLKICRYFFSDERDGWQTDRGMIYMVFGPPRIVNRSLSTETWSYDNGTGNDLNFIFRKNKNELSENDFVLDRNIMYKADWYKAVDFWRNGRIGLSN